MMFTADVHIVLLTAAGLFLAGVVKGATGLGYSTCALPFVVTALGLKPAMAVVLLPAMATNVAVAVTAGHLREVSREFAVLYLSILPGIAAGLLALLWVQQSLATTVLGLVIVAYALLALFRPTLSLDPGRARALQLPTGLLNGVITGLTGSQVMPLFPFMMALDLDKDRLVQAINLAVLLTSLALAGGLLLTGIMSFELFSISSLSVVPALAGVAVGGSFRRHIPPDHFKTVVLVVLLIMGVALLMR